MLWHPSLIQFFKSKVLAIMLGLISLVIIATILFFHTVLSTISQQQVRLRAARTIIVDTVSVQPWDQEGVAYYGYLQDIRAVEHFAGSYYAATSGGLVALDEKGRMTAHYTTLDGLPENTLTALAAFQGRLYIGTTHQGLLSFDGRAFSHHLFIQPKAHHITALAATDEALFIGTFDGGLFHYNGQQFRRLTFSDAETAPEQVTVIFPRFPNIYVGSFAHGLFVWREGHWDQLTTEDGLPSNRVTAIIEDASAILLGTDMGVIRFHNHSGITPMAEIGNLSSLARFQDKVYAGLFTGQIIQLDAPAGGRRWPARRGQLALPDRVSRLFLKAENNRLWALSSQGIYSSSQPGAESFERFDALADVPQLSASHISALAIDRRGRLWVGYFDRGIDLLDRHQFRLITHLEGDAIREINFLRSRPENQRMLVATSAGLIVIDQQMRQQHLTETDGIISNSVSHVLATPADLVASRPNAASGREEALILSTARGLSVYAEGMFRSLNAFHGLASNHLYTSARVGNTLFVGSLNGLNALEGLRVVRTFQTSTSRLSHNWVSALLAVEGTLYIGTTGGGVDVLLPSGEMMNSAGLIGRFSVNPNALHFDGDRLYAGTLDQGVWVLSVTTGVWSHFTQGLGSNNITAITSDDRSVYFGSDQGLTKVDRRRW